MHSQRRAAGLSGTTNGKPSWAVLCTVCAARHTPGRWVFCTREAGRHLPRQVELRWRGTQCAPRLQEYEEPPLTPEAQAREMDAMKGWINEVPHAPGPELAAALAAAAYMPPDSTSRGIVILNAGCARGGTRAHQIHGRGIQASWHLCKGRTASGGGSRVRATEAGPSHTRDASTACPL